MRFIGSGTAVANIGLAVNDRVKKGDDWVDEATFVDVTLWGRTAEIANEHLEKGSNVLIEGRLKLETWETDGQKRQRLKVVCERLQFMGSKPKQTGETQKPVQQSQVLDAYEDPDIPF
jgi:single-strand DNA-binding protein